MSNEPLPAAFLLSQGKCCGSGCTNCPYMDEHGRRHQKGETNINQQTLKQLKKSIKNYSP